MHGVAPHKCRRVTTHCQAKEPGLAPSASLIRLSWRPLIECPLRCARPASCAILTLKIGRSAIGRLYRDEAASRPEVQWFWSFTVLGPARGRVRTKGHAPTLDQGQGRFPDALGGVQGSQCGTSRAGTALSLRTPLYANSSSIGLGVPKPAGPATRRGFA